MDLIWGLFGQDITLLNAALALGSVIALIVLCVWALKFVFRASGSVGRGRNRRLLIVDQLPLDQKRQLLIVRRDNVEHLIMTGGPQDMVLESHIPVEPAPARPPPRRPPTSGAGPSGPSGPDVQPARSTAASEPPRPVQPMETLRELARPEPPRRGTSLRHTGLMRPNQRADSLIPPPFPENSDYHPTDSANGAGSHETSGEFRDLNRSEPPVGNTRPNPQR